MSRLFRGYRKTESSEPVYTHLPEKDPRIDYERGPYESNCGELLLPAKSSYCERVRRERVGLTLPSWYQPCAPSILLRKRQRSKQWVTYEVEMSQGKKKLIKRNPPHIYRSALGTIRNQQYRLVEGQLYDEGQLEEIDDQMEPQQKFKLIILFLLIPSVIVMFYCQNKFKRESNIVGDLSGLGLPHNFMGNGAGAQSGSKHPPYDMDYHLKPENYEDFGLSENFAPPNHADPNESHDQSSVADSDETDNTSSEPGTQSKSTYNPIVDFKNQGYKVIYYSNHSASYSSNIIPTGQMVFSTCQYEKRCYVTNELSLIDLSDAVISTESSISPGLAAHRHLHQTWIFYRLDPIKFPISQATLNYNLTWTYLPESNLTYRPKLEENRPLNSANNATFNFFNVWRNKDKMVLIVTQDCTFDPNLIQLASLMEKASIDVDLISLCDEKLCPDSHENTTVSNGEECFKRISQRYLFLFDFQSSFCPGYISPTVTQSLTLDLIPIIADLPSMLISSSLPEGSFINSLNFSSLHHLSDYLNLIASDPNEFQSYMTWKQYYKFSVDRTDFCNLCSYLHGNLSAITKVSYERYNLNSSCVDWKSVYHFTELLQN